MYKLERHGILRRTVRLVGTEKLTPADFAKIAVELGVSPRRARKSGKVAARQATAAERIETRWNGKESTITAEVGDWVVTALAVDGAILRDRDGHANTYAIKSAKFTELYGRGTGATEFGAIFEPKGKVMSLFLSGGFNIIAPWGEEQRADVGYLLLNGAEVYGNHRDTFEATYAFVG